MSEDIHTDPETGFNWTLDYYICILNFSEGAVVRPLERVHT